MKSRLDLPAILGGPPAVTMDHAAVLRWPRLSETDAQAVLQVMCDGDISTHRVVRQLENAYADYAVRRHAMAYGNGAMAFLAAYHALGLRPGDEVLAPGMAPATTILPMLWLGALPVFCDMEDKRLGIDPEDVDQKITSKSRVLVVSHTWGMPCKLKGLLSVARKYNLKVIEDASQSLGAFWRERPCGSFGDISVFRLQSRHLAPAGEGAVFLCNDSGYYERALTFCDPLRLAELPQAVRNRASAGLGLNSRMAPLCAAIGLNQFGCLEENNAVRNANLSYLSQRLADLGLNPFFAPRHIERVYTEFIVQYDARQHGLSLEALVEALNREGCEATTIGHPMLYQQPLFSDGLYKEILRLPIHAQLPDYNAVTLPVSEAAGHTLIRLPAFPGPDHGILDQYVYAFDRVLQHAREIADFKSEENDRERLPYTKLRLVGNGN